MCRYKCISLTQQLLLFQTVEVTGHNMSVLVGRGSNLYFHFTDTFLSYITFSVFTQRGKCSLIKERIKVLEYKKALELHSEYCTCFNLVLELRPLFSGLLIKMTAEKDLSLSLCSVLIYTHSVSFLTGEDSQVEPGADSAAFPMGELVCATLLGDAGEDGCGVSVLSLTASSASSLCCTEDRYCSSRLQSALSAPSLPLARPLQTGLSARTVFRESAVPLLRKLSSCATCWSQVNWKPESGKETSVLGGLVVLEAMGGVALQSPGDEIWAGVAACVTTASCCSTDCFHCCIAWNYTQITQNVNYEFMDRFLETILYISYNVKQKLPLSIETSKLPPERAFGASPPHTASAHCKQTRFTVTD